MERIITINSNELPKSVITKDILTDKLQKAGFTVCDEIHPETELIIFYRWGWFLFTDSA